MMETENTAQIEGDAPHRDTDSSRGDFKAAAVPHKQFWLLSVGVCISLFLTLLDSSIVATSLYTIGVEFEVTNTVNWVALAYTLAYLGCAVTFARVSDVIGRRNTFFAGQIIFVAFSIGCGFSQNLPQLVAFRTLQGIGGSGIYSLSMVILPELCPPSLQQHMGSVIGMVLAGSGVIGPVLGGILTYYADWRWIFWIKSASRYFFATGFMLTIYSGPIGVISVAIFWLTWPQDEHLPTLQRRRWAEFDVLGSLLIISAATLVVFAFQNAGETPGNTWGEAVFIAPLVLGIGSWAGLILWERLVLHRFANRIVPTFPVNVFRNRVYTGAALSALFIGFPYLLLVFSFPLRAQIVSGKSPLLAGVMLLPMLGTTAVGSVIGGKINTTKDRLFESLLVGSALMTLACGLLTTVSGSEDDAKALGFLTFAGLGFGLSTTAATMITTIEVPIKDYAPAQGIIAQLRILGGSLGISASTVFVQKQSTKYLAGILTSQELASLGHANSALSSEQLTAVHHAYTKAFQLGMITAAGISGAAVLLSLLAFKRHRKSVDEKRKMLIEEETERRRGHQSHSSNSEKKDLA